MRGGDPSSRVSLALLVLAFPVPVSAAVGGDSPRRVGVVGVTLALPAGWRSWVPSTAVKPTITDPLTRIVAVSAPFHFAATGCQIAGYAFPATAVAIVVVEWVPNPGHSGAEWSSVTTLEIQHQGAYAARSSGGRVLQRFGGSVEFNDHGRALSTYILAGREASAATVARARSVLDTLRVHPR